MIIKMIEGNPAVRAAVCGTVTLRQHLCSWEYCCCCFAIESHNGESSCRLLTPLLHFPVIISGKFCHCLLVACCSLLTVQS